MSTIDSWLQNQPATPQQIDGMKLYRKTINNLTFKATASGGLTAGTVIASGCWSILAAWWALGPLAFLAIITYFFLSIGDSGSPGQCIGGFYLVVILAIIIGVVWLFNKSEGTGESRAVLSDPTKAAEAMRQKVADLGARGPTARERERIIEQVRRVQTAGGGGLKAPDSWFVYDEPVHSSFTLGRSIFLTRELVYSDHLGGLLAHELGRLQNGDGQLRLAVQQLLSHTNKAEFPHQEEWVEYWRQQVFLADEFAAQYGFGRELIRYLELYQPLDVAKPYLWQEEPYIAERIDRLEQYLEQQGSA